MTSFPLLSNVRHRAMITPVSPLCITAVEPVLELQAPTLPLSIQIVWLRIQNKLVQKIKKNIVLFA